MPKSLVLGNGNMLATLDQKGHLHDFYFPYVGMEDHTTFGHYHRLGIYEEESNKFSWFKEDHWQSARRYLDETLVGETKLTSQSWQLEITFIDFVHPIHNLFCRKIVVKNLSKHPRNLRLFFNYDFHIYGVKGNDTAYYDPKNNSLIFYKYNRYFLLNAQTKDEKGISQFTTGKSEYKGLEGTWRNAESGTLAGHPIEQGSVDATFAVDLTVQSEKENTLFTWLAAGENLDQVEKLNLEATTQGIEELLDYTTHFWRSWVNKQQLDFTGVPDKMKKLFKQSLLIIRTQIDNHGAIIAANDSDIMKFNKDTYSYMWARDSALIAISLDNTGYGEITKRFYQFCAKVQTKDGYLLHKYNPDGSLGSSWHPWLYNGQYEVPLQEDETALPILAIRNHCRQSQDLEFIQTIFDSFVLDAAHFLCQFVDEETGLPLPSYDPWEEQKGIFTYTASTVYAGLVAAAELSQIVGHKEYHQYFAQKAESIKKAIVTHLYCPKEETFVKKVTKDEHGNLIKDYRTDASISAIFLMKVLPADDPKVVSTMKRIKEKLSVKTDIGGLARYENDSYQAVGDYPHEIPGNPWIITSLWYAQWLLEVAKKYDSPEFHEAESILNWIVDRADTTMVLPEQLNPYTGEHLSVAPLTWSHATYVDTIMLYRQKLGEYGICAECQFPLKDKDEN